MGRRVARLPKFVHGYLDRHGRPRHYLRRPGRKEVPLPGLPWSTDFMDAYHAALNEAAPVVIGAKHSVPGTVAEAVARYLGSAAFLVELAASTQGMRHARLQTFRNEHGEKRIRMLKAEHVAKLLSHRMPYEQRNMLKTLRGLMAFALVEGLIDNDPTASVKLKAVRDTGGFETWPVDSIQKFREHHKLGTRARLALEILYGTMQRRGDVVRLGRQHIQHGELSLRQQKTGAQVVIPVLPELQAAIDATPHDHLTFLVTEFGKPFSAAGFGNWFREQCDMAGLPKGLSAHGLRKAGATRLADHGCTDHEIMAWGGWTSMREVQRYTEAANRRRLAQQGADKIKAGTELANLETWLANQRKKS